MQNVAALRPHRFVRHTYTQTGLEQPLLYVSLYLGLNPIFQPGCNVKNMVKALSVQRGAYLVRFCSHFYLIRWSFSLLNLCHSDIRDLKCVDLGYLKKIYHSLV